MTVENFLVPSWGIYLVYLVVYVVAFCNHSIWNNNVRSVWLHNTSIVNSIKILIVYSDYICLVGIMHNIVVWILISCPCNIRIIGGTSMRSCFICNSIICLLWISERDVSIIMNLDIIVILSRLMSIWLLSYVDIIILIVALMIIIGILELNVIILMIITILIINLLST
jgi:hypothetical protein